MQLKNESTTGMAGGIRMVPLWAWVLAGLGFSAVQLIVNLILSGPDGIPLVARLAIGLVGGTLLGGYLLLVGYVNRDSRRRGMSGLLWTVVAVLIPNGLGIVLYFVLRQPLTHPCPQCGNAVQTGHNFCAGCSHRLSPSCPHCRQLVGAADIYCPHCGTALRAPALASESH